MRKEEHKLGVFLKARYPYIYVQTWEEERFIHSLLMINREFLGDRRAIYTWTQTAGFHCLFSNGSSETLKQGKTVNSLTSPATEALLACTQLKQEAIFVFKDFHIFLRAQDRLASYETVRTLRDILPKIKNGDYSKNLIFLSPTLVVPEEMQKEITVFDYPLPDVDGLTQVIDTLLIANEKQSSISEADKHEIAKAALGMTSQEAENAFSRAVIEQHGLDRNALPIIFDEKKQVIRKSGILEYVDSHVNVDDIGGLDVLKTWLKKRNGCWMQPAEVYSLPAPKGVLITGIPGCGKSMTAKAMSSIWGLPLLQLDMGRIYSGLVGSSEENIRRAISTAEAMAPCVLWLDEIEKGLAGVSSSNDSGTAARVFGTLLTWMQEKTSMVFILATSNDISALPPELQRKGRFDEIFFVDLPNFEERRTIFKLHVLKRVNDRIYGMDDDDALWDELAQSSEGFVGAEIEEAVIAALFDAYSEQRKLNNKDILRAIRNTVPLSRTQSEKIEALRKWANTRAVAATSPRSAEHSGYYGRILEF